MKQEDAKSIIVSKYLQLSTDERTENAAECLSFECVDSINFKCSGDKHQVIMGWLTPHIVHKRKN